MTLSDNNFHKKYYLATIPLLPDACEDVTETLKREMHLYSKEGLLQVVRKTHLPLIFTQLLQQVVRFLLYFHPT